MGGQKKRIQAAPTAIMARAVLKRKHDETAPRGLEPLKSIGHHQNETI